MVIAILGYVLILVALGVYADDLKGLENEGYNFSYGGLVAVAAVILVIILACLILDIVCIVKRGRRTLSPKFFLIINVIQTIFWTVEFILGMIGARSGLTIGVGVLVW